MLSELVYPGWQATVDGAPAPILPADLIFRSIALSPGRHEVSFVFRPIVVPAGAAITLITISVGDCSHRHPGRVRKAVRVRPAWRLALIAWLLAAFALRVHWLDTRKLNGDEAFGYFFALRPYPGIVQATLSLREPHPVANYFVQKAWSGIAGDSEFALRFASVW